MPTKKITKSDSKNSKVSEKKVVSKTDNKKDTTKKVVVKRRKVELVPTKASAVAIASQASRAKKQALIDKVASSDVPYRRNETSSDTKIPLWVWMFFGCSLLLFCISFYQAIIRPQIESENVVVDDGIYWVDENVQMEENTQDDIVDDENTEGTESLDQVGTEEDQGISAPETAIDTISEYFRRLSNRNFDGAFDLMIPALRGTSEIRDHFTSFRMNPFLDGIEGGRITPTNFEYVKSPTFGKDVYRFDLSYVLASDQSKYEETWEFAVNTKGDQPRISSIRCITSKCSYHPIFWPENFGLMR